jgi:hypothetical protein
MSALICRLQRATLAEKEVTALKEQLANQGPSDNNNKTSSSSAPSSSSMPAKQANDASDSNPGQGESGARPGHDEELAAKEKEVSTKKNRRLKMAAL